MDELQKDDVVWADVGSIFVPLTWKNNITIKDIVGKYINEEVTEDAEFEILPPKQLENGK